MLKKDLMKGFEDLSFWDRKFSTWGSLLGGFLDQASIKSKPPGENITFDEFEKYFISEAKNKTAFSDFMNKASDKDKVRNLLKQFQLNSSLAWTFTEEKTLGELTCQIDGVLPKELTPKAIFPNGDLLFYQQQRLDLKQDGTSPEFCATFTIVNSQGEVVRKSSFAAPNKFIGFSALGNNKLFYSDSNCMYFEEISSHNRSNIFFPLDSKNVAAASGEMVTHLTNGPTDKTFSLLYYNYYCPHPLKNIELTALGIKASDVHSLHFLPDGNIVCNCSFSKNSKHQAHKIFIINPNDNTLVKQWEFLGGETFILPDGNILSRLNTNLFLWNADGEELACVNIGIAKATILIDPQGRILVGNRLVFKFSATPKIVEYKKSEASISSSLSSVQKTLQGIPGKPAPTMGKSDSKGNDIELSDLSSASTKSVSTVTPASSSVKASNDIATLVR